MKATIESIILKPGPVLSGIQLSARDRIQRAGIITVARMEFRIHPAWPIEYLEIPLEALGENPKVGDEYELQLTGKPTV
jgi:hypothetical protein